jgi:hypothetical protein
MFGRARTSGLPILESKSSLEHQANCHRMAREQHKAYAERMKRQYDLKMRAKECPIQVGDTVLFRREITRKNVSPWDPHPFTVFHKNGSLISAKREYPTRQVITRNSSRFELWFETSEPKAETATDQLMEAQAQQPTTTEPTSPRPVAEAKRPASAESSNPQPEREALGTSESIEDVQTTSVGAPTSGTKPTAKAAAEKGKRSRGRPTAAEAALIRAQREAEQREREEQFPALRKSSRLATTPSGAVGLQTEQSSSLSKRGEDIVLHK